MQQKMLKMANCNSNCLHYIISKTLFNKGGNLLSLFLSLYKKGGFFFIH